MVRPSPSRSMTVAHMSQECIGRQQKPKTEKGKRILVFHCLARPPRRSQRGNREDIFPLLPILLQQREREEVWHGLPPHDVLDEHCDFSPPPPSPSFTIVPFICAVIRFLVRRPRSTLDWVPRKKTSSLETNLGKISSEGQKHIIFMNKAKSTAIRVQRDMGLSPTLFRLLATSPFFSLLSPSPFLASIFATNPRK